MARDLNIRWGFLSGCLLVFACGAAGDLPRTTKGEGEPELIAPTAGQADLLQLADGPLAADLSPGAAQPAQQIEAPAQPAEEPHKSLLQRVEERAEKFEEAVGRRVGPIAGRVEERLEQAESAIAKRVPGVVHEIEHEAKRIERGAEHVEQEIRSGVAAGAHRLAEEAHEIYDSVKGHVEQEQREARIERHHERYTVEPNDSYWAISKKLYGTPAYFKALYWHNREQYPQARELRPGDVISTPELAQLRERYPDLCPSREHEHRAEIMRQVSGPTHLPARHRLYVVQEGDTLSDIALYELGRSSRWTEIYQLNRQALGQDFDYLPPGLELALPSHTAQRSESIAETLSERIQR